MQRSMRSWYAGLWDVFTRCETADRGKGLTLREGVKRMTESVNSVDSLVSWKGTELAFFANFTEKFYALDRTEVCENPVPTSVEESFQQSFEKYLELQVQEASIDNAPPGPAPPSTTKVEPSNSIHLLDFESFFGFSRPRMILRFQDSRIFIETLRSNLLLDMEESMTQMSRLALVLGLLLGLLVLGLALVALAGWLGGPREVESATKVEKFEGHVENSESQSTSENGCVKPTEVAAVQEGRPRVHAVETEDSNGAASDDLMRVWAFPDSRLRTTNRTNEVRGISEDFSEAELSSVKRRSLSSLGTLPSVLSVQTVELHPQTVELHPMVPTLASAGAAAGPGPSSTNFNFGAAVIDRLLPLAEKEGGSDSVEEPEGETSRETGKVLPFRLNSFNIPLAAEPLEPTVGELGLCVSDTSFEDPVPMDVRVSVESFDGEGEV